MSKRSSVTLSSGDLDQRLDKLLALKYPDHSRSYFQYLIEQNSVLVNGRPAKKRVKGRIGDLVEIEFEPVSELGVTPEPIPLDVLFEDDHVLVVNKPSGMVVHPAPGSPSGTFASALLHYCKELNPNEFEALRPGIVHRLDKETTGVIIAAKTTFAHQKLAEQFALRQVEKSYLTICSGAPKEGEFSAPIKRHPVHRTQMSVSPDGKEAISHFKILAKKRDLCLVKVKILTGRTHQIRVHLKSMNCPILGDSIYGSPRLNRQLHSSQLMLHAHTLKLSHPITEAPLEILAHIPEGMKNFIELIDPPL